MLGKGENMAYYDEKDRESDDFCETERIGRTGKKETNPEEAKTQTVQTEETNPVAFNAEKTVTAETDREDSGRDESDKAETSPDEVAAESSADSDETEKEYEDVCFICRRPESKAGKMFKLPNHICVCPDCMHKTMDTVSQFDYHGMLDPDLVDNLNKSMSSKGYPNIRFVNIADLQGEGGIPNKQKLKKKKKAEETEPILDIRNIPPPHKIKAQLDDYVIGQEHAKKVISVAVYNHYKRVFTGTMDEIEIEKSNMLMIGPTGCGKTYLVKTLAKLLDVPLAITDATSLTEAGYIGDDIESVVSKLLAAADNDVEKAERGIIFIDEIDKIARKKNTTSRDVSGESVQQGMLRLLEGAEVEVPVGANSKNAMVPLATINTRNILFICGGAFPDLEEIIKQRLRKQTSIGFNAELKDKLDKDTDILSKVTIEDLKKFGMIPEFLGRLPVVYTLKAMDKEMLVKILKEPKNAILKQYQKLLELDAVELIFDDGALDAIAEKAMERDIGARALRAIIEEFMLDIMYEIPKDDNIGRVTITREYIEGTGGPVIDIRNHSAVNPEELKQIEQK
jgi:ATP-dependent Clp protease ATP-binding subunit ClpX